MGIDRRRLLRLHAAGALAGAAAERAERDRAGHLGPASLTAHSLLDGLGIGLAFQVAPAIGVVVAVAVLAHDVADGVNTVTLSLSGGGGQRPGARLADRRRRRAAGRHRPDAALHGRRRPARPRHRPLRRLLPLHRRLEPWRPPATAPCRACAPASPPWPAWRRSGRWYGWRGGRADDAASAREVAGPRLQPWAGFSRFLQRSQVDMNKAVMLAETAASHRAAKWGCSL